ncbi:hypothetical protein D9M68_722790 [compost metagenome]
MKLIRMCWSDEVRRLKREVVTSGGWTEAKPQVVDYYELLVEAGNEIFGPGTHWTEIMNAPADQAPPDIAVKKLIDQSMKAWMDGNMKRHIQFFTQSAVFVAPTGQSFRGHGELLQAFEGERAAMPGLKMIPDAMQVIHLARDTAIVLMMGSIEHNGKQTPERWTSTQAVSYSPQDGWRIASLQVFHAR